MKKREPKESLTYDEKGTEQVSQQIMNAYFSGSMDEQEEFFPSNNEEDPNER
jgi:hypothetical protein